MPKREWNPDPELYFEELVRYYQMASTQQHECNLGSTPHLEGTIQDPLMQNVELYDVVNIKYAGFKQVLIDMWYGYSREHPYFHKMHRTRDLVAHNFSGVNNVWELKEWLYVWIIHAVTGSGINYAKKPSGYNNTILPYLHGCDNLRELTTKAGAILSTKIPAYTSVGYQFPRFPKPGATYKRGGDRFIVKYAPRLAADVAFWLEEQIRIPTLRELGDYMFQWNRDNGLTVFKFQYAAVIGDVANYYPHMVDITSPYFHGTNAVECISYMTDGKRNLRALDAAMDRVAEATGGLLYDLEDVCCDFIRWVENYIRPGADYDHLDRDAIWNTSRIKNHPFGRQETMLRLGLVESFNGLNVHPSDDYVLRRAMWDVGGYVKAASTLNG